MIGQRERVPMPCTASRRGPSLTQIRCRSRPAGPDRCTRLRQITSAVSACLGTAERKAFLTVYGAARRTSCPGCPPALAGQNSVNPDRANITCREFSSSRTVGKGRPYHQGRTLEERLQLFNEACEPQRWRQTNLAEGCGFTKTGFGAAGMGSGWSAVGTARRPVRPSCNLIASGPAAFSSD
jgi:hypothetical protein